MSNHIIVSDRFLMAFIIGIAFYSSYVSAADALEELLNSEKAALKESSPATKKLWDEILLVHGN